MSKSDDLIQKLVEYLKANPKMLSEYRRLTIQATQSWDNFTSYHDHIQSILEKSKSKQTKLDPDKHVNTYRQVEALREAVSLLSI